MTSASRAGRLQAVTRPRFDRGREDGAIAILTAIMSLVLFMIAALIVDLGLARDTRRQAQNAADAATLAAANVLYGNGTVPQFGDAVVAAKEFAFRNFGVQDGAWAACADTGALRYATTASGCISFQNATDPGLDQTRPDTVRVRIPVRDVRTGFGALAGVTSIPIASEAEAGVKFTTVPGCAVCVLGPGTHSLQNGKVYVEGGDVHFNGGVSANPGGSVTTSGGRTTVEGGVSGGSYSPAALTGQPPMADPLAFLPMPSPTGPQRTNPCTDGPGRYGAFTFPNATCTLAPGTYVIAGSSALWKASGEARVTGTGVTLYFTCGSPAAPASCLPGALGGTLDMGGSATFAISAPTSGSLRGLAIVYDRNNSSTLAMVGSAGNAITGTVYAVSATIRLNGNGCISTLRSMLVVKSLAMFGDPACLTSRYSRDDNVLLPPQDLHLSH